jgi:hypothetical protein
LRGFSIPALLFKPSQGLSKIGGCGDITILPNCESFYINSDWSEAPCLELGMLKSFYPPFEHRPSSVRVVSEWARRAIIPNNYRNLLSTFVIKDSSTETDQLLIRKSDLVCEGVVSALEKSG